MGALDTITALSLGSNNGYARETYRHDENILRQGLSHPQIVINLFEQIYLTVDTANRALISLSYAALSTRVSLMTYAIPIAVGYLVSKGFINHRVRQILNFTYDHLGDVARVVSLVSYVVLLTHGQVLFAASALTWTTICILKNKNCFSEKINNIISPIGVAISSISTILTDDWLLRIINIVDIFSQIVGSLNLLKPTPLNFAEIERKDRVYYSYNLKRLHRLKFSMNRGHLLIEGLPPILIPTQPAKLNDFAQRINFDDPRIQKLLAEKLAKDKRYTAGQVTPKEYVSTQLSSLITRVGERKIEVKRPSDYANVEHQLKFIAHWVNVQYLQLPEHEQKRMVENLTLENWLFDLVISGAYSDSGEMGAIGKVYCAIVHTDFAQRINFDDPRIQELLTKKLADDDRYKQVATLITPKEYITIELESLITQVSTGKIKVGAPRDYTRVQYQLNYIAYWIIVQFPRLPEAEQKRMQSNLTIEEWLFDLAVSGGNYCGAGELRTIGNVKYAIIFGDPNVPFIKKLPFIFQLERQQIYNSIEYRKQERMPRFAQQLIFPNNQHKYNTFEAMFEEELGLQKTGAREETPSDQTNFLRFASQYLISYKLIIKKWFFIDYNVDAMVTAVQDFIANDQNAFAQFCEWWRNYIERSDLRDKGTYVQQLYTNNSIYGHPLQQTYKPQRRLVNHKLVELMLFELGYFNITAG